MNKLEVGMYVRYKTLSNQIKIAKIIEIDKKVLDLDNKDCTTEKYIIDEPSHNIIGLIEVGDYVNGYEVTSKDQFLGFGNHDWYMTNDEIKSIVTKEQFSSMEYRLGDK